MEEDKGMTMISREFLSVFELESMGWPVSSVYGLGVNSRAFAFLYGHYARRILKERFREVLDVGTGPGLLPIAIYKKNPKLKVTGVDIAADMIRIAKKNAETQGAEVEFVTANGENLPFPSNSFGLVVSTGAMHHWKKPEKVMNEIYRVVKPGGKALIFDHLKDAPNGAFSKLSNRIGILPAAFFWADRFFEPFYTKKEAEALVSGSKFSAWEIEEDGMFLVLRLHKRPARRA